MGYSPWGRKESDTTERLNLTRGPCRVINWPDFNVVVSQGMGVGERLEERNRGNGWLVEQSEHTYLLIKFTISYGYGS